MKNPTPNVILIILALSLSGCSFVGDLPVDETLSENSQENRSDEDKVVNRQPVDTTELDAVDVTDVDLIESILELDGTSDVLVGDAKDTTDGALIPPVVTVNIDPVAMPDDVFTTEDSPITINTLLDNDTDAEGDILSISSHVGVSLNGGVVTTYAPNVLKYEPAADFHGVDSFVYTISDGKGGQSTAIVTIQVAAVNDVPIAKADAITMNQNASHTLNLLANDGGLGDAVTMSITGMPVNGSVSVGFDGEVSYTPSADFFGTDSFTYQITDADGDTSMASVDVVINCLANCARTFQLTWDASVSPNVVSYKVYVGEDPNNLDQIISVGNVLQYDHPVSIKGTYYFAVAAVSDQSTESTLSSVEVGIF